MTILLHVNINIFKEKYPFSKTFLKSGEGRDMISPFCKLLYVLLYRRQLDSFICICIQFVVI